ncbi:MAG: hydrogenase maturation protease [Gemmatimonadetes bacterium]|nr:hydrogenase maturation protease [Gemmatimonadota bacterium]
MREARRGGDCAPERGRPEAARPELPAPARRGGDCAPERGLLPALRALLRGRIVVMGIGNPLRGDDGVGSALARQLQTWLAATSAATAAGLTVLDAEEIPESWLGPAVAARPDVILLIDAVALGAEPGAAALLSAGELGGPVLYTHRTPLRPVVDFLAHETGAEVALLGIQPGPLDWGEALSPALSAAAADLLLLLIEVLEDACAAPSAPEAIAC